LSPTHTGTPTSTATPLPHSLIYSFGGDDTTYTGNGLFVAPWGIAVDNLNGWVYVTDDNNNYLQKFNASNGNFISQQYGNSSGVLLFGVAVDPSGNVYVADQSNLGIRVNNSAGVSQGMWQYFDGGYGGFDQPDYLCMNSAGTSLVVADFGADQLDYFNLSGQSSVSLTVSGCTGAAMDSSNNLWVTSSASLYKFAPGAFGTASPTLTVTTANGKSFGQLQGVAVDSNDNVYVADRNPNNRVVELTNSGSYLYTFTNPVGTSPGGVALDSSNNLYITDVGLHKVYKYSH
jgi:DNA-binding beta-propeller fold protein YncE